MGGNIGVEIDWKALAGPEPRHRIPLPTYPFERKRHWIEPHRPASAGAVYTNGTARDISTGVMETGANGVQPPLPELEALIEEQLRIMAKQIEVLRIAPASSQPNRST